MGFKYFDSYQCNESVTSIERKSRMRQIRGIKGEAVVDYCEPLITKGMVYQRLS
jgi:hypothetical protein